MQRGVDRSLEEAHLACVTRYYDRVWNRGDLAVLPEVVASDVVGRDCATGEYGFEELRGFVVAFRDAFPDFETHAEIAVADGDWVAARFRSEGTFRGLFMGLAPSGVRFRNVGLVLYRFRGGRIVEIRTEWDHHRFFATLGASPETIALISKAGDQPGPTDG
jgi:predicted ester cyclase